MLLLRYYLPAFLGFLDIPLRGLVGSQILAEITYFHVNLPPWQNPRFSSSWNLSIWPTLRNT